MALLAACMSGEWDMAEALVHSGSYMDAKNQVSSLLQMFLSPLTTLSALPQARPTLQFYSNDNHTLHMFKESMTLGLF